MKRLGDRGFDVGAVRASSAACWCVEWSAVDRCEIEAASQVLDVAVEETAGYRGVRGDLAVVRAPGYLVVL